MNIAQELDNIRPRISDKGFLANEGLSNELGLHIFDYAPKDELLVRDFVARLKADSDKPFNIIEFDLYEMLLEILSDDDLLDKVEGLEVKRGKEHLLSQLQRTADSATYVAKMQKTMQGIPTKHGDVVFITGVGKVFPFMRAHLILDAIQKIIGSVPVVLFYPGEYDGQQLKLFGSFAGHNYYRAFHLLSKKSEDR
jgi:hypothetical protein